jgi:hypothetical protein
LVTVIERPVRATSSIRARHFALNSDAWIVVTSTASDMRVGPAIGSMTTILTMVTNLVKAARVCLLDRAGDSVLLNAR